MTKNILGLDLGTNSIGWALIDKEQNKIISLGSRIVPMGAAISEFEKGNPQTKNAERRSARSIRRMGKRYKSRRNKLLFILHKLGILPEQFQFSHPFNDPTKIQQINLLPVKKGNSQLSASELMKLKVRALNEKIELKELGKLIFSYNQLRGYSGGGDEEDEIEIVDEKINEVSDFLKFEKLIEEVKIVSNPLKLEGKKNGKDVFELEIEYQNDFLKCETILNTLKKDDVLELQIIIRRDKNGSVTSRNLSIPLKTNWRKSMEELEDELDKLSEIKGSEAFLCEYFYGKLKEDKNYRIRNKVILRKRYQAEFDAIWDSQLSQNNSEFKEIIENKDLLYSIADFIFPGKNPDKKQMLFNKTAKEKGFKYLIRNQIIYFQRELKDQSDLIGFCRFEKNERVVPKSHPLFQEFKILEQINKLTINSRVQKGVRKNGEPKFEYQDIPLNSSLKEWLFNELQLKKEVSAKGFYAKLEKEGHIIKNESFLNGIHRDSKFKGNETIIFLKKQLGDWFDILKLMDIRNLISFWELLYNSKGNEYDLESERCIAIKNYLTKNCGKIDNIDKLTVRLAKIKFARVYSSLSLKAIESILPLMRVGKHFDSNLPEKINTNLIKIINENQDDSFLKSLQEHLEKYQEEILLSGGMGSSYATILFYGKHTAQSFTRDTIKTPNDIQSITHGELRNPLAEQMINETLKMVKEIWSTYKEKPNEIRIELARELKNSAEERSKISKANEENRKINEQVKQRLIELNKEISLGNIERYRLWRMQASEPFPAPASFKEPTHSEVERMRLWEEQKCVSPYTGQPIPLSKLFDRGLYDIDHVIPKSRYFDDSLGNKVVCERSVNIDKGNRTAWEYFEVGSIIESILSKEHFINHVNQFFHGKKRKNLLATKIPQDPIARQLKDTQYISTRVREELSKIVGSENIHTTTGGVTDYLRRHWGLTDKFKEITKDRFDKALELIKDEEKRTNTKWSKRIDHRHHAMDALIVACTEPSHIHRLNNLNKELQDWLKTNKDKMLKDFSGSDDELMDAFVNLSNESREKLMEEIKGFRNFDHPWKSFSIEAKKALEEIIVSHKPKEKLFVQKVQKGVDKDLKDMLRIRGKLHDATFYGLSSGKEAYKIKLLKLAGKQFATEKTIEKIVDPVLKETIKSHLLKYKGIKAEAFSAEGINEFNKDRKIPVYGFKIFYKDQAEKFNLSKLATKKADSKLIKEILERMTDSDLKNKIISHLDLYGGDNKVGFSKEGIDIFNKGLEKEFKEKYPTKNYKFLSSIKLKATQTEIEEDIDLANLSLLQLSRKSSYNDKLMIATGSNYAFAVLEKEGKRHFDEISFFHAAKIVNQEFKNGHTNVSQIVSKYFEDKNKNSKLLFLLKQDEVVYLPQIDEIAILDEKHPDFTAFWNDKAERAKNVYTVVKFSGNRIYFLKHDIANIITNKQEFGSQNCYEKINNISIKDHCFKLHIDRLGNIFPFK